MAPRQQGMVSRGLRAASVDPLGPWLCSHRILRLMLLHLKYLYGIRVEVRGTHHFPASQPYVVVSNHQSSLDLLGETPPRATWCCLTPFSLAAPRETCLCLAGYLYLQSPLLLPEALSIQWPPSTFSSC